MTPSTPCRRHSPRVWMVACADCTAWHLPAACARRDWADRADRGPALRPAA